MCLAKDACDECRRKENEKDMQQPRGGCLQANLCPNARGRVPRLFAHVWLPRVYNVVLVPRHTMHRDALYRLVYSTYERFATPDISAALYLVLSCWRTRLWPGKALEHEPRPRIP